MWARRNPTLISDGPNVESWYRLGEALQVKFTHRFDLGHGFVAAGKGGYRRVRKWKPTALRFFSPHRGPRLGRAGKRPQPQFGFQIWDQHICRSQRWCWLKLPRCTPASRGEARECASLARSRETRKVFESVGDVALLRTRPMAPLIHAWPVFHHSPPRTYERRGRYWLACQLDQRGSGRARWSTSPFWATPLIFSSCAFQSDR